MHAVVVGVREPALLTRLTRRQHLGAYALVFQRLLLRLKAAAAFERARDAEHAAVLVMLCRQLLVAH